MARADREGTLPSLHDFEGRWHLSRRIDDSAAGGTGVFEGIATLRPDTGGRGPGMIYEEAGELRLGGLPGLKATRRYLWRDASCGMVEVLFSDGRDFHRFNPRGGVVSAWHDCPPDLYEVSYNFILWPVWQSVWHVKGPRKDYVMVTDYRR